MVQVKFYGNRSVWAPRRDELSGLIHSAMIGAWEIPADKRFHRFCWLDDGDLIAPRSDSYLIIEIICFTGRTRNAKRALIDTLCTGVAAELDLDSDDLEIVILESPRENWGIRGRIADELDLNYRIDV